MFDAEYFRKTLARDVEATGGHPTVEVQMLNGHSHRVHSVVDAADGHVTLETFHMKGDLAHQRPRFGDSETEAGTTERFRVVLSYESIAAVVLDPTSTQVKARPGFA